MLLIGVAALLAWSSAHAQTPEAVLTVADSLVTAGDVTTALPLLVQAVSLAESRDGSQAPVTATALFSLGRCQFKLALYTEADSAWSRALAIREQHYGKNSTPVAQCLHYLAVLHKTISHWSEAETLFKRAIDIRQKVLGPEHPDLALSLGGYANLLLAMGRLAEAERNYKRCIAIAEKNFGDQHTDVAAALNNLAALYHIEGRFDDAEPLYLRALDIYRAAQPPQPDNVAQTLKNLAELAHEQEKFDLAEQLYREALDVARQAYGLAHPKIADNLSNLARLLTDLRRLDEAEPLATSALDMAEATLGANSPDVAEYRKNLGDILQSQGRWNEAQAIYKRALADVDSTAGKEHRIGAMILRSLALLEQAQADFPAALRDAQRAYLIRRKNFSDCFGTLSERDALDFSQFLQNDAANYLSILINAPDGAAQNRDEIAKIVFSTKGLVTDGVLVRNKFLGLISALNDSVRAAKDLLSKLDAQGPAQDNEWRYALDYSAAAEKRDRFESELAAAGNEFRDEKLITQLDAKRVAGALPTGSALVEYMRYRHQIDLQHSEERYLAVLVKANGRTFIYPLGVAAVIDSAVAAYRRQLANPRALNLDQYYEVSYNLYALIWQPFETQVNGMSDVLISPDAALSLVSFAGLRTTAGNYLIENFPLCYIASGRDRVREPVTAEPGHGLLAIGDPDYDAPAAARSGKNVQNSYFAPARSTTDTRGQSNDCTLLRDIKVAALPGSRTEVEQITAAWKVASAEPVVTFFGAAASEDNFRANAHGQRVIHLATHGYYVSGECKRDLLQNKYVGESPLLQSGLFFAGSNLKGVGADDEQVEDGTLTAEEVSNLNLLGTDLVVLSACETGLGEVRFGEGVFGLRRAFQMAGAKTVISALWPVDDKTTAQLMGTLFTASGSDLPRALQQAEQTTLNERRRNGQSDHPFYWAAFILTGE